MSDMNSISLTGRLTKDCTVTTTKNGAALVKFAIANNTGFGEFKKTTYFDVTLWGKLGESINKYLTKGKQVALTGRIEDSSWTTPEGEKRKAFTVTATEVILLGDVSSNKSSEPVYEVINDDEAFKRKYAKQGDIVW